MKFFVIFYQRYEVSITSANKKFTAFQYSLILQLLLVDLMAEEYFCVQLKRCHISQLNGI